MSINAYLNNAQAMLSRSVRVDLNHASVKVDDAAKSSEINIVKQEDFEKQQKETAAKLEALKDRSFCEDVLNFFSIDDQGEADTARDLALVGADLDKTVNQGTLIKTEQKEAIGRVSDAIQDGKRISKTLTDTVEQGAQARQGE